MQSLQVMQLLQLMQLLQGFPWTFRIMIQTEIAEKERHNAL